MYRDRVQWTKIRRRLLVDQVPIRQVVRETGISRKTIRKMLAIAGQNNMDRVLREPPSSRHTLYLLAQPSDQQRTQRPALIARLLHSIGCDPYFKIRLL